MSTTTTPRFGRRGAGTAAPGPTRPNIWASDEAAAALGAATGRNRTPATPSLASLLPAEPRADAWLPSPKPAAPTPGLLALLFSSQGRMRRRDYWLMGSLALTLYILALGALYVSLPLLQALIGALPVSLLYVWIKSCLGTKRWHDRDKSGVWNLIVLLPMIGSLWVFVECGCLDGTPGPNRFGPSPK